MALLSVEQRREYFAFLGLGEYNEENIKKFQKMALRKKDVDGKYGTNTDNALRHFYNVKKYTKNFKPEEFKCECNGRYCTGYPDYMKPVELQHIQKIRDIYGKPITVTCGLRCKGYNAECKGSITNSLHLTGYAIDFYQAGVTDTLANRKKSIKTIKTLPNHHYTYGNGINSNGVKVNAPYMGNALHTDTNPGATAPTSNPKNGKLTVDGFGGPATITALQTYLKLLNKDGCISGQRESLHKKYFSNITAVTFGGNGSTTVRAMQKWLGVQADGIWGEGTSMALQRKLGVAADGKFGPGSVKALQKFLNAQLYPDPTPTPDPKPEPPKPKFTADTFVDVSDWQDVIDWAKVKESGIGGAIVRYADGDVLDKKFTRNMQEVKKYGLHLGVYIFSRAKTKAEAERDAQRLYDAANEYDPDMPYYIDLEQHGLERYADTVAIAFLNKMAKLGVRGGVYANLNWWNNYLTKTAKDYSASAFWLAQWNDKITHKNPSLFGLWQYSSSGSVPGIPSERVDMNKCFVKYWEKKPTPKPEPTPTPEPTPSLEPKKTIDELAWEVLLDKWGSDDARKKALEEAGYDYNAVQAKVNELVPIVDKIAHEVIDDPEKWGKGDVRKERLEKAGYNYYAIQKRVNEILNKSIVQKCLDACVVQADWAKNAAYKWVEGPTIENSKKWETCVTYVAVVLQRINILKRGQYIWIDNKGKVEGANSKMTVAYMSGTLKSNKSKLKKGDIVIGGNGKTGAGQGSHIFILTGAWNGDNPYIYDQESANRVKSGKEPHHTWKGSFATIAVIRLVEESTPTPEPAKKHYTGTYPSMKLVKSTAEVISDAQKFARWITSDKRFGYGRKGGSKYKDTKEYKITHSGGCHFCGTNAGKISKAKKAGLKNPEEWEYTYVCNTFVCACYAHAGIPSMLNARGHAWWVSSYQKSKYWSEVKKPSKYTDLKAGDVLFTETHAMLYLGNGKIAEATSGGGDPSSSKSAWENSIKICNYSANRYKSVTNVFRLTGSVNSTTLIRYGEVSARVGLLQKYLIWYGALPKDSDDCIFGDATLDAVKKFQKEQGLTVDGIVGKDTLAKMAEVVK